MFYKYTKEDIMKMVEEQDANFIRLQFIDIAGILKNVAITKSQLENALDNKCTFDGSSIEGFVRIEESDMYLRPDLNTFTLLPWRASHDRVARLICDIYTPDGDPFTGDPRYILRRVVEKAEEKGYEFHVGPECEFFIFHKNEEGKGTVFTHDNNGYFDLDVIDEAGAVRREVCLNLEKMGFQIEASHHEVAPGQHEIDFKYDEALTTADNIMTFKLVVKAIAQKNNAYATFMPKPVYGVNGSGMHLNMSFMSNGQNLFYDPKDPKGNGLSSVAYHFMAGLLTHAKALAAVCNPLVNSYKRLVAGYEAPVYIAWACKNRSPLIRVPAARGMGTRIEFRSPDPSANPYLAIACCLAAGLDGVERELEAPDSAESNLFEMTDAERAERNIDTLPPTLKDALIALQNDEVLYDTMGEHVLSRFVEMKQKEWDSYRSYVSNWEVENYLQKY